MAINEKKALGYMKESGFGGKKHTKEAKDFIAKYNKLPEHKYAKSKALNKLKK